MIKAPGINCDPQHDPMSSSSKTMPSRPLHHELIREQDLQAKVHDILENMMLMMLAAASTIPVHISGPTIHHRALAMCSSYIVVKSI